ncbi:serine/threonine-protein kinase [Dactylosporangium sp. CA-233914]|uniref:serine/threonine-protein kinase n=1 Tax=Dactylosporangium sp. CA-233914 TaxID=3239934 RepID=UPI003D8CC0B7
MLAHELLNGRYQVDRLPFPHDGMSEVWPARDTLLDRAVVVKVVGGSMDVGLMRRFRREAQLTARLNHPGVPAVFDLGQHKGRPFLILQHITGDALDVVVDGEGPLPIPWVCAVGAQISSVLIAAEQLGLVHRDLKPGNVMLEPSGAVKVIDFGLAAMHGDQRYSRITRTGESLGTLGYMAPEQINGTPVDHRTDLYGLGGILFHLLTGEPPFDEVTTAILLQRQLFEPPPRPSRMRSDIPDALDDLVHALLAEQPDDRPASATDVYDALVEHAAALPPMPAFVTDGVDAVRAYAAVVGRQPAPTTTTLNRPDPFDPQRVAADAQRLAARGEFRLAARRWRELARWQSREYGNSHPLVVATTLQIARAHESAGEPDRALSLLNELLSQLPPTADPDGALVRQLADEIERLRSAG